MRKTKMLNTEYYDRIYSEFEHERPWDAKQALGYVPMGDHRIRVKLEDGGYVDYTFINSYGKYVRERPNRREDITREYVHNDFADKLKNMMDRRGFTQKTLAEATGISQGIISGYLRRNAAYEDWAQKRPVNPTIDKVHLIAWALQCDPYELL